MNIQQDLEASEKGTYKSEVLNNKTSSRLYLVANNVEFRFFNTLIILVYDMKVKGVFSTQFCDLAQECIEFILKF
jgi:hypothetical protein